jgi:aspartate kinase
MIVMKFGGSALQTANRICDVVSIVRRHLNEQPVLVLSAMGTTTDDLIEAGHRAVQQKDAHLPIEKFHRDIIEQLGLPSTLIDSLFCELASLLHRIFFCKELTPQTYDDLLSYGERCSVRVFSAYLDKQGISASPFDAWDVGILTSSDHTQAEILPETYEKVPLAFQKMKCDIPVITGFIGKDQSGKITTLGRGGSDLTASVIGRAIMANEVQLWKDVSGILVADPRLVPDAKSLGQLSFVDAAELARFGAEVLHPTSIWPVMNMAIPVRVRSFQEPDHPGTLIESCSSQGKERVVAIAHKSHQVLAHITPLRMVNQFAFLTSVFQVFNERKLPAHVIAATHNSVSITFEKYNSLSLLQDALQQIATTTIEHSKSTVSLIGTQNSSPEFFEAVMHVLNSEGITTQMISYGISNCNITLVINDDEVQRCVEILHQKFFTRIH